MVWGTVEPAIQCNQIGGLMPGPFIHMSSMRHAARIFAERDYQPVGSERIDPTWTGWNTRDLARLLQKHPNFAALGAVGPDLFFFLPDFRDEDGVALSSVLVEILRFLEDIYAKLDPYISKYERYLGPISEDTAEEMSRLTGGLTEVVGDITGELSGILITALEDFVTQQHDWWEFFSLGLNKGYDEQAYFWSDMLHYRETGEFGRSLWRSANQKLDDDSARSYALGYLTHLATDVTGHAFVNAISGGPFRLHWQRHHLVENHMDAYWYLRDPLRPGSVSQYPQWTESALYYDVAFAADDNGAVSRPVYPTGGTLREVWTRRRLLDIDSTLPDDVANVLLEAIKEVFYEGRPHPRILRDNDGQPSTELIKQAYDLFFRYLKLVSVDGFSHEPPDAPDVFPNLDFPTMSDPQAGPPDSGGDGNFGDDLLDFILSVVSVLAWLGEVAVYFATLPWAVVADVITYPERLGLYYALELPLFHMLKNFRAVLVMTGYLAPMADEIALGLTHVGLSDATSFQAALNDIADILGGLDATSPAPSETTWRDEHYPYYHVKDEFRHPWAYPDPGTPTELLASTQGAATAGPHGFADGVEMLFGDLGSDPEIRDRLESSGSPQETDDVGRSVNPHKHLGDVVSFSKYLLWLESRDGYQGEGAQVPLVQWNLDSDRGYGYHCWDWNRDAAATSEKDPEGNPYQPPCTPPQQSDSGWNADTPLKLHYVGEGLVDPGCEDIELGEPSHPPEEEAS